MIHYDLQRKHKTKKFPNRLLSCKQQKKPKKKETNQYKRHKK